MEMEICNHQQESINEQTKNADFMILGPYLENIMKLPLQSCCFFSQLILAVNLQSSFQDFIS